MSGTAASDYANSGLNVTEATGAMLLDERYDQANNNNNRSNDNNNNNLAATATCTSTTSGSSSSACASASVPAPTPPVPTPAPAPTGGGIKIVTVTAAAAAAAATNKPSTGNISTPLIHSLTNSHTHALTHSLTHSLAHSFTHSRTLSLIHSRTHSRTLSLTHSSTPTPPSFSWPSPFILPLNLLIIHSLQPFSNSPPTPLRSPSSPSLPLPPSFTFSSSGVLLNLVKSASARSTRASVGTMGGQGLGEEEEGQQRLREIVPLDYTEAEKQVERVDRPYVIYYTVKHNTPRYTLLPHTL